MEALEDRTLDLLALRRELADLCRRVNVVKRSGSRPWLSLDRLWVEVNTRTALARVITEYLRWVVNTMCPASGLESIVLVSPDTVSSAFGITPVLFIAADRLGVRAAVWQEQGDLVSNKPLLIGSEARDLDCVVVQDVIRHGVTILKMRDSLEQRGWVLRAHVGLVLNCWEPARLQWTKDEFRRVTGNDLPLQYLLSVTELV
jgi:hypothetical protein